MGAKTKPWPKYNIQGPVVVTGGSGFLGQHIVEGLIANDLRVIIFDLRAPRDEAPFNHKLVRAVQGNLCNIDDVRAAVRGAGTVIHCASPHAVSNNKALFQAVNVDGTRNVIQACKDEGVKNLVYTSSASVVNTGTDLVGTDESVPLPAPADMMDYYTTTKAAADVMVREAACEELGTVAIRPHGLFGPADVQLMPVLSKMGATGKSKWVIGDGENVVDFTYIGNVAHSHLLAADALAAPARRAKVNGQAYYITNDEPVRFWDFMATMLHGMGWPEPSVRLPFSLLLTMSYMVAALVSLLGAVGIKINATFTPSRVKLAGTHHWYKCDAAKRDLGYKPHWTLAEGVHVALDSALNMGLGNPRAPPGRPWITAPPRQVGVADDKLPAFSMEEVKCHVTADDMWMAVEGRVYDVSDVVERHPGGEAIFKGAGIDATEGFFGTQHPDSARSTLAKFLIGRVAGAKLGSRVPSVSA